MRNRAIAIGLGGIRSICCQDTAINKEVPPLFLGNAPYLEETSTLEVWCPPKFDMLTKALDQIPSARSNTVRLTVLPTITLQDFTTGSQYFQSITSAKSAAFLKELQKIKLL